MQTSFVQYLQQKHGMWLSKFIVQKNILDVNSILTKFLNAFWQQIGSCSIDRSLTHRWAAEKRARRLIIYVQTAPHLDHLQCVH